MIINIYAFKRIVIQNSHFIMKSFIHRRKKRVAHNIEELLTPRAVAYWFMDDGTSYRSGRHRAYRFSTHSFPFSDQERLVQALRYNFGISARSSLLSKRIVPSIDYIFGQNPQSVFSI